MKMCHKAIVETWKLHIILIFRGFLLTWCHIVASLKFCSAPQVVNPLLVTTECFIFCPISLDLSEPSAATRWDTHSMALRGGILVPLNSPRDWWGNHYGVEFKRIQEMVKMTYGKNPFGIEYFNSQHQFLPLWIFKPHYQKVVAQGLLHLVSLASFFRFSPMISSRYNKIEKKFMCCSALHLVTV